ncbi:NAD(P)/FAD-dependent oxidoreductase [Aestuariivirga litoralis]|uniref:NAD(P)/FAD-dependent oxidoreductase n=1 Tax=Aestuariivirga litoralis TaxID=2650924 RepID=UPI0018C54FC6|nr:FAD-binding oxidoreductase [Aestuariivirga litoralis]MBG1233681.1 FAD-binding oxidoreductase [Aestuariivirga litoralis]
MTNYDVVIVGGGIVGSSTAYFLRKNGFKGSIAVIEKDPTYAKACTPLSWGGIRKQFSNAENVHLSTFGLNLIRNLKSEFGPESDISFRETGYLVLASEASVSVLEENAKLQNSLGADTVLLSQSELTAKYPYAQFEGIAMGSLGRTGEGWFDPYGLLTLIRKGAIAKNVTYLADEVVAIDAGREAKSVTLQAGGKIGAGVVVNAGGASGGAIAAMVGFDLPVSAAKRYVYIVDCPKAPEEFRKGPAWFNTDGVYWRPEGRNFLFGFTPGEDEEPKPDWEMEHHWFEERLWPSAAERIPVFEEAKVVSSYVGHYDYNWFDQNGIIGRHPSLPNFYFGNGFSGHGIQQGPATGNAISELIIHGEYKTIDLKRLGVERIAANQPLFEKNIF